MSIRKSIFSCLAIFFVLWAAPLIADEVKVETVLTNLSRPISVAVRPGGTPDRYEVFVAESGTRRIIRMLANEPNRASDAITGFPESPDGYGGPTDSLSGLLFLDETNLVVSLNGAPPELRLYELTESGTPVSADQAKQQVTPELPAENVETAIGIYRGLTRTRANDYVADMLIVAISGGRPVHGVWKVPIRANMLGAMTEFEMNARMQVNQLTSLAVSEQGYVIAIEASDRSGKNQLMFLNPTNGLVVLSFSTDFSGIDDLAYSPKSGNLFVIARAHVNDKGGLFRIDVARQPGERQIDVTKLADIERPTGMAFSLDGTLYVTTVGDDGKSEGGALLKVTGDF